MTVELNNISLEMIKIGAMTKKKMQNHQLLNECKVRAKQNTWWLVTHAQVAIYIKQYYLYTSVGIENTLQCSTYRSSFFTLSFLFRSLVTIVPPRNNALA